MKPFTCMTKEPAHCETPVKAWMFASFVVSTFEGDIYEQYQKETGKVAMLNAKTPIEAMIDKAAGVNAKMMGDYIDWLVVNYWGEEKPDEAKRGRP